jgi:hypothetical protein
VGKMGKKWLKNAKFLIKSVKNGIKSVKNAKIRPKSFKNGRRSVKKCENSINIGQKMRKIDKKLVKNAIKSTKIDQKCD